jgi:hypothetical protein
LSNHKANQLVQSLPKGREYAFAEVANSTAFLDNDQTPPAASVDEPALDGVGRNKTQGSFLDKEKANFGDVQSGE